MKITPPNEQQSHRISSEHRQIAQSAALVAAFVLLAKIVAAGKEVAVAWKYGVGDIVDGYQIANAIMLWAPNTLGGTLMIVLIPVFLLSKPGYSTREEFGAELQGWAFLIGVLFAGSAYVLLPTLIEQFWSTNSNPVRLSYIHEFSGSFFLPAIVTLPIFIYSALLMSAKQQWNTLLEGAPALSILICILIFQGDKGDINPLYWGTLTGYIVQALSLYLLLRAIRCEPASIRISLRSGQWKDVRDLMGFLFLSQFFLSWATPIDMAAAVKLGEGAVAQLSYAERLLSLIIGIGSIAISRAVLPVFSEMAAAERWSDLLDASLKWGTIMFFVGLAICAIAWPLSELAVGLLYQRGAFTESDTKAVAEVFSYGLTRVPFHFAGVVFFQLLASQRNFLPAALITLACVAIKYPLNNFLSASLGSGGINLATGVMYSATALLQLVAGVIAIRRRAS